MKRKKIINLSVLSVIALIGVILMQAYWVNSTISATQAHAREHIRFSLNLYSNDVAGFLEKKDLKKAENFLYNKIFDELKSINKPLKFKVIITNTSEETKFKNNYEHRLIHITDIDNQKYIIEIIYDSTSWIWDGQIFWWVIISVMLILIVAASVTVSLIRDSKLKKLEDIKKDFVSNITHELKTPIATINVASKMLLASNQSVINLEKTLKYSRIIHEENNRLQKLVDKVLMLSIFDKSIKMYNFENQNLVILINESVSNINLLAQSKKATISFNNKPKQIFFNCDKVHIKNLILNLLENALKYSDEFPEININLNADDNFIKLEISDNGPGIPDDEKDKIFTRFHRVKQPYKNNVSGFGMGLSYVYRVIEAHGGKISIHDNKPKGSVFKILFPK